MISLCVNNDYYRTAHVLGDFRYNLEQVGVPSQSSTNDRDEIDTLIPVDQVYLEKIAALAAAQLFQYSFLFRFKNISGPALLTKNDITWFGRSWWNIVFSANIGSTDRTKTLDA